MGFAQTAEPGAYAAMKDVRHEVFWLDDQGRPEAREPLVGRDQTDLVVIGGGLSGLWTALRAKERYPDLDVVLLEGDRLASAASGRNGGFLAASVTHGDLNGLDRWPEEFATLHQMGLDNYAGIADTVARFGIDCDLQHVGELDVATEDYQVAQLREQLNGLAAAGVKTEFLDAEATRAMVNSPTYRAGVLDPNVGIVNPARLCWGLAAAAESLGVRIHEHTAVSGFRRDGAAIRVRTFTGEIRAARVALTTAAYQPLLKRINAFVVPVFDHVVVTAPLPAEVLAQLGWAGRQGVGDSGNQFHYYRLTADDRLLWGGYDAVYQRGARPGSAVERDDALSARLVQHLHDTFPVLREVPIEYTWAGAIDTCSRFSAFWGRAFSGQVAFVAGFTGLGVGASRFGADVLVDLLADEHTPRSELDMVRSKPLPFPPEPARQWVIDWTRSSLQAADAHGGRRNLWLRTLDRLGLGFDS